jgi:hypothetical protein
LLQAGVHSAANDSRFHAPRSTEPAIS